MMIYALNEYSIGSYGSLEKTYGYFDSIEKAEKAKEAIVSEYSKEGYKDYKSNPDRYRVEKFAEMNKISFETTRTVHETIEKYFFKD